MTTKLTIATASEKNKGGHFASCFAAKQITKNRKEVLRLAVLRVAAQNKHTQNNNQNNYMGPNLGPK